MYVALSESRRLAWPAAEDITNPLKKRAQMPGGTVKYTPFQVREYIVVQNTYGFIYNVYVIWNNIAQLLYICTEYTRFLCIFLCLYDNDIRSK